MSFVSFSSDPFDIVPQAVVDGEIARDDATRISHVSAFAPTCSALICDISMANMMMILSQFLGDDKAFISLISMGFQMQLTFTNGELEQKMMATEELKQVLSVGRSMTARRFCL